MVRRMRQWGGGSCGDSHTVSKARQEMEVLLRYGIWKERYSPCNSQHPTHSNSAARRWAARTCFAEVSPRGTCSWLGKGNGRGQARLTHPADISTRHQLQPAVEIERTVFRNEKSDNTSAMSPSASTMMSPPRALIGTFQRPLCAPGLVPGAMPDSRRAVAHQGRQHRAERRLNVNCRIAPYIVATGRALLEDDPRARSAATPWADGRSRGSQRCF